MLENMQGKKGIDVSENNGTVDWAAVKAAGVEFAIIRLGYGNRHLDSTFYENINGAIDAGLAVGVYFYSYALTMEQARGWIVRMPSYFAISFAKAIISSSRA